MLENTLFPRGVKDLGLLGSLNNVVFAVLKPCPLCGRVFDEFSAGGRRIVIRGLCPDDKEKLLEFYEKLRDETIYTRFFSIMRHFAPYVKRLVSSSNIYAVIAEDADTGDIVGVAELVVDESGAAEGGIVVLEEMQGKGIGSRLADTLARIARERGIRKVYGYIMADNIRALRLVKKLGGRPRNYYSSMIYVEIPLGGGEGS